MVAYTYSKLPTANFNTTPPSIARSATGSVYDVGDTGFTTPLNMTMVVGGAVVTTISSNALGFLPDFSLDGRVNCVWKQTGSTFATVLTTSDPIPGPPGPNTIPTDTAIKNAVTDPASLTAGALNATYEPKGAAAAAAAGKADANPAYLEKWFANGIRGKKLVLVGDSTTDFAYGLNRALVNYYTRAGRELDGVTVLNYGQNGQTLSAWLADTAGRYGKDSTVAMNADLYVLSYGINDVRTGTTSEDALVTSLSTAVDALRANGTSTVLLRVPPTFTTTDTGALGTVTPLASAQAYSTLLRNAYIRVAAAKGCALLDTQALVYGLTSKADTDAPYMLNQIHPNDAGNAAVARELVKLIGAAPSQPPVSFSMRGRAGVGSLGKRVLPSGGRVAFGFVTYRPTLNSGTTTLEVRKIAVGGASTVIGTASYSGGFGSGNVFAPQGVIADWTTLAAGEAVEVAITTATATVNDITVYVAVDEPGRAAYYPLKARYNGLVNSVDGAMVYPATQPLDASQERDIRGLKALQVKRLGYNRITKWSQDFSQTVWVKLNATVAGTAGAQTITATAAGAGVYQVITVTPGEQLTFSWKGSSTAASPKFGVYDQTNAAFLTGATQSWPAADGTGWRDYTFTVPAGCTSLRVYPVGHSGVQGAAGDVHTINATMLSAGAARLTYAATNAIGTSMIVNTGALPADVTLIRAVKTDAFVAGQASVVAPGINTDGNPALQGPNAGKFGFPVIATRGTVTQAAAGAWQFAVIRATGGNVYVTLNDQPQSPAYAKAVNATDLRLNLLSSTDTTGSFQNWDGEFISEYYPYLLTEGEAMARVRDLARVLLAAGETVTSDWPTQKLA